LTCSRRSSSSAGVSLKHLDPADPKLSGKEYRLAVAMKEGISQDNAKKVSKIIRGRGGRRGVKGTGAGRGTARVRPRAVTTCSPLISLLKSKDFDFALQFINYR